ncbi:MAG: hypothetical protein RIQ53_559 [Pseudomonadota bacterium]|jgi:hypothetical protein
MAHATITAGSDLDHYGTNTGHQPMTIPQMVAALGRAAEDRCSRALTYDWIVVPEIDGRELVLVGYEYTGAESPSEDSPGEADELLVQEVWVRGMDIVGALPEDPEAGFVGKALRAHWLRDAEAAREVALLNEVGP